MGWILIVISLANGQLMIEERGFRDITHCEKRKAVWSAAIDTTRYRIECIPGQNIIKPKPRHRDKFEVHYVPVSAYDYVRG